MSKTSKLMAARRRIAELEEQVDLGLTLYETYKGFATSRVTTLEGEVASLRESVARVDRSMAMLAHYLLKAMGPGNKRSIINTLMRMAQPANGEQVLERFSNADIDMYRDYRMSPSPDHCRGTTYLRDHSNGFSSFTPVEIRALVFEIAKDVDLHNGKKGVIMSATVGGSRGRKQCFAISEEALQYLPVDVVISDALQEMIEALRRQ